MKSLIPKDIRAKTLSNITVVCVGIALAVTLLHLGEIWAAFKTVLRTVAPFIIGFMIAFLLMPIVSRAETFFNETLFRRKPHPKLSRAIATIIAYVVFLSLLSGFFAILVPQLITSVKSILQYIANFVSMNRETINQLLLKYEFLSIEGEQLVIAWENVVSQLMNYTSLLVNNLMAISSSIYTLVFQMLVGMIAAFYLLMDREKYCAQVKKLCYGLFKPSTCETLIYWTRRAHKIFSGFITGKILDSMIIGLICYVCMLLFRIEYPLLISVIVGFTNIVPFFGPLIGAIPSALILLLIQPAQRAVVPGIHTDPAADRRQCDWTVHHGRLRGPVPILHHAGHHDRQRPVWLCGHAAERTGVRADLRHRQGQHRSPPAGTESAHREQRLRKGS